MRAFNKWPYLKHKNKEITWNPWLAWHNFKGERVTEPVNMNFTATKDNEKGAYEETDGLSPEMHRHSRPRFHLMLETQLEQVGIKIQYGHRAVRYFETPEQYTAGVELDDGKILEADLVVAADGIGSHSTKITMGEEVRARSTGISIYRTSYPVEIVNSDPEIVEKFGNAPNGSPLIQMWMT
jgi:2-polyprenyl-6-methoxyphenol hydroxylase-like FAD-dependent oxidoreductase